MNVIGIIFRVIGLGAFSWGKLAAIGAILAALTGTVTWWSVKMYNSGWRGAIDAIARQDKKAIADATRQRDAWRDCRARGLRWDTGTGKCSGG